MEAAIAFNLVAMLISPVTSPAAVARAMAMLFLFAEASETFAARRARTFLPTC